ncbi:MAG TPA: carboxylate-amine ligase [Ktedonobacteraceae bacterium]|jgi:carboxylate-amine ligase
MPVSRFSLGIEEEFQSVDSRSGELCSSISTLFEKGQDVFGGRLHAEWVQSMVELTTSICPDIGAARRELLHLRTLLAGLMQREGLRLLSAGTHPTSLWQVQEQTDRPRYHELAREYQDVARMRVLFGLHVHVGGVSERATALRIINQLRTWLPHLLALSANSPFWAGRLTGLKSYRSVVWQSGVPRSGVPEIIPSLADFERYIDDLTATQCIRSGKDIWWYVRPHFLYNTIEFRICDMPATLEDTLAIAALCQALVAKLAWLDRRQQSLAVLPRHYIEENLWRAMRYGLDAHVADFVGRRTLQMREALHEVLDLVEDVIDDLGSRREITYLRALLEDPRGTGADRQIAVYRRRENVQDVIGLLLATSMQGMGADPVGEVYAGIESGDHFFTIEAGDRLLPTTEGKLPVVEGSPAGQG